MSSLFLLLLLAFIHSVHASIFCPHPVYPSTSEEFVTASIQTREQRPSKEAYYRIAEDGEDPAFKRQSARFRLMTTRDSTECPFRGCLSELAPSEPKNHGTSLYQTSVIGKMIPPGFFAMDVPQRLYCVVTDGDCGATIPLYRHYRWTPTGIYHAYTIEADTTIEGYTKELTPLCYVWPVKRPEVAASEAPATLLPSLSDILQRLAPKTTPVPASPTTPATPKKTKTPKDSTEEEIRQENLNIVKETKPTDISEEVEGSGAEEPKEKKMVKKTEKKVARDQMKKKTVAKDEPKKPKEKKDVEIVEKKTEIKPKNKKKEEKKKTEELKTTPAPIDDSTSSEDSGSQEEISAEQLIGADRILHFESTDEPKTVNKTVITERIITKAKEDDEMPKPTVLTLESESVLKSDEDEERARELAKFNGRKSGKEPIEIGEQNDERPVMLHFEESSN